MSNFEKFLNDPELIHSTLDVEPDDNERNLDSHIAQIVPCLSSHFNESYMDSEDVKQRYPPKLCPEESRLVARVFGDQSYHGHHMRIWINSLLDIAFQERKSRVSGKTLEKLIRKGVEPLPSEIHWVSSAEIIAGHAQKPYSDESATLILSALFHDVLEDLPQSTKDAFRYFDIAYGTLPEEVADRIVVVSNFYKPIMRDVDTAMMQFSRDDPVRVAHTIQEVLNLINEDAGTYRDRIHSEISDLMQLAQRVREDPEVLADYPGRDAYESINKYFEACSYPNYINKISRHDWDCEDGVGIVKLADNVHNLRTRRSLDGEEKSDLIAKNLRILDSFEAIIDSRSQAVYTTLFQRAIYYTLKTVLEEFDSLKEFPDPKGKSTATLEDYGRKILEFAERHLEPYKIDLPAIEESYDIEPSLA